MKILSNKYLQSTLRHAIQIAGVYVATKYSGNTQVLGVAASASAYLLSLLDKYNNFR